jgi:signal transduction histidine kinase
MRLQFPTSASAILSPLPQHRTAERFGLALAIAALAVLLRGLLDPLLGHVAFYVTVYMAVAFCAVVCGLFPAILGALVGFLGIFYLFVDPRHSLSIPSSEIHNTIGFFLVSAVLTALGVTNRRKQMKLDAAVVALTSEANERNRAERDLQQAHDLLERRVEERTAALSQALTRLEVEVRVREQAEEQLRHLSLRLMTTQDEERRRIARELHDSAGQTLAAIKMTVASFRFTSANAPDLFRFLDEVSALVDEVLQEIRTASYLLHPPLLDEAGIASAARWFVEGFAKRSGILVSCDIAENMERPPRLCELVLFRALQESLTNVHRHSGASSASVTLKPEAGQLKLEVGDNGGGIPEDLLQRFNTASRNEGVGIAGMRERVRELGGQLDIRSGHKGTTVSVTLPLPQTPAFRKPLLRASAL